MTTETITWHSVKKIKPDADITVLCWIERDEEWRSGWYDGEEWFDTSSGDKLRGVTHWADLVGPK